MLFIWCQGRAHCSRCVDDALLDCGRIDYHSDLQDRQLQKKKECKFMYWVDEVAWRDDNQTDLTLHLSHGEASLTRLIPLPLPALKLEMTCFRVGNRRSDNQLPRPSLRALNVQGPRISQAFTKPETFSKVLPGKCTSNKIVRNMRLGTQMPTLPHFRTAWSQLSRISSIGSFIQADDARSSDDTPLPCLLRIESTMKRHCEHFAESSRPSRSLSTCEIMKITC